MKLILDERSRGRRAVTSPIPRPGRPSLRDLAPPGAAAATALYGLHRLGRRSGVTAGEAADALPGDEIVSHPIWQSTRGTTISAPPEQVWPWVVQMGFPSYRAGWYTPSWLDRVTFGIRQRSADRIVPQLQHLAVGDRVPDSEDWSAFFTVEAVDPPHALVLHSTRHVVEPFETVDFSWAFVIREVSPGRSRLLVRARLDYAPRRALPFVELVLGPADFVKAGAMLRGIRRRAERGDAHPLPDAARGPGTLVDLGEPRLAEPGTAP